MKVDKQAFYRVLAGLGQGWCAGQSGDGCGGGRGADVGEGGGREGLKGRADLRWDPSDMDMQPFVV